VEALLFLVAQLPNIFKEKEMLTTENISVYNLENAIKAMRLSFKSLEKSDSEIKDNKFVIGEKDLTLALKLIQAGPSHSKFLRQIFISMEITAPLYWW
jgi:hypothetical protein